jgi:hypothetical protein
LQETVPYLCEVLLLLLLLLLLLHDVVLQSRCG